MRAILRLVKYSGINLCILPFNLLLAWSITLAGHHYLIGTAVGYVFQAIVAFFINRFWTFKKPQVQVSRGIPTVVGIETAGAILLHIGVYVLYEYVYASFWFARIAASLVAFACTYILESVLLWKVPVHK